MLVVFPSKKNVQYKWRWYSNKPVFQMFWGSSRTSWFRVWTDSWRGAIFNCCALWRCPWAKHRTTYLLGLLCYAAVPFAVSTTINARLYSKCCLCMCMYFRPLCVSWNNNKVKKFNSPLKRLKGISSVIKCFSCNSNSLAPAVAFITSTGVQYMHLLDSCIYLYMTYWCRDLNNTHLLPRHDD